MRMKIHILLLIISLVASVVAEALESSSWNDAGVVSQTYTEFLDCPDAWKQLNTCDSLRIRDGFHSSVQSWGSFWEAFVRFLSRRDDTTFLSYHPEKDSSKSTLPVGDLRFSLLSGGEYHIGEENAYSMFWYGASLNFNLGPRLFFDSDWWFLRYQGDLEYADSTSSLIKGFRKNEDGRIYLDNVTGHIDYYSDYGVLSLGRDTYQIGDNISGSVILSDFGSEFGYLSWYKDFGPVSLSFLHGSLLPDSTNNHVSYTSEDRYIALHKLDWQLTDDINWFMGEEVLYGNRAPDISYMIPQSFYRIGEHNDGDRDNVLIFTGLSAYTRSVLGFYMNFMLDELRKDEIFGDWWGNKYAFQSGLVSNFHLFDKEDMTRAVFEFIAVRPWMYTHKKTVNAFSHDGSALGYPEGSNLISYAVELNVPIYERLRLDTNVQFIRQGSLGNDWAINYNDRPKDTARWLEGELSERWRAKSVITWKPLAHHAVKAGFILEIENEDTIINEYFVGYQALY